MVLALILGVMSFINMTTDLLPNMDLPYAVAYTTYIGASPEQVEQSVTKPMESALAATSGLKNITSVSQENVSIVVMEFEEGTGMDSANAAAHSFFHHFIFFASFPPHVQRTIR